MRERNPFLIRTAERINNEDDFIKLFSPKIIDIIKEHIDGHSLWNQFFRFQSSPGGGKTSLLKLFSPRVLFKLRQIFKSRTESNSDIDSLFNNLKGLGVYDNQDNVNVLALYISCASDYDKINNLTISDTKKSRLFISLLNSRIFISFIRSIIDYFKINKPNADLKDELKKVKLYPLSSISLPTDFPIDCNALDLYEWSGKLEKFIYREIDGLHNEAIDINEHTGLFSAQLLTCNQIFYEGKDSIPSNIAIQFDDVQKLALDQCNFLINEIIEKRPSNGIWFAERLDLFNLDYLWSREASTEGRDYFELNLEEIFRGKSRFKDFAVNIAEKRVERAKDVNISSFPSIILDDIGLSDEKITHLSEKVIDKIKKSTIKYHIYESLIKSIQDNTSISKFETLTELRILQILIERKEKKDRVEPLLFSSNFLEKEYEIEKKKLSSKNGNYLLKRDYDVPFYFGFDNLVGLSNSNVEQFLAFSGRLFENFLSSKIIGNDAPIDAQLQEKIFSIEVEKRWNNLNTLSSSQDVKSLLKSVAMFCSSEDDKPGFPYRGVTGFALKLEDRKRLTDPKFWENNPHYETIAQTLTVAISNNLLEVNVNRKQGQKGSETKTIFYLNRWICLKYNLSFGYSGWRSINLDTLGNWIKRGYYKKSDKETMKTSTENLYD